MTSNNTYVALTAGHILADGGRTMIVRPGKGEAAAGLTIAIKSVRYSARPLGRLDEMIDFRKLRLPDNQRRRRGKLPACYHALTHIFMPCRASMG